MFALTHPQMNRSAVRFVQMEDLGFKEPNIFNLLLCKIILIQIVTLKVKEMFMERCSSSYSIVAGILILLK